MDSNKENANPPTCGPDCSCSNKKGLSPRTKIILLFVIIAVAGTVLANSLANKSRKEATPNSSPGYAVTLPQAASSTLSQKDSSGPTEPPIVSFKPLASLSALNTDAMDVDGVFILLVKSEADKTPAMLKEIVASKNAIVERGTRMGTFQLSSTTQDFAMLSAQLQPPGVVIIVKGRGMKGVSGADINQTKLLQAFMGAMQPTSCCAAGGNRVCK
jgi:hypothetical protein